MSTLARELTFLDVRKLIYDTAWEFHRRHGGEVEELIAEGNLVYLSVYESWDPDISCFTNWLRYKIWRAYQTRARTVAKTKARFSQVEFELNEVLSDPAFDLRTWMDELSDDARTVARLALFPNPDVRLGAICRRGEDHPDSRKRALVEYLTESGWPVERVTKSFQEIQEALA